MHVASFLKKGNGCGGGGGGRKSEKKINVQEQVTIHGRELVCAVCSKGRVGEGSLKYILNFTLPSL